MDKSHCYIVGIVTYQLKGGVVQETDSSEVESLTIFETLNHLPDEVQNLKSIKHLSKEIFEERKRIIKKLRAMADYLAKTHSDVLIADRVGTGVGIGSGVLFIGGLIAAPFTAGISLALTVTGTATGRDWVLLLGLLRLHVVNCSNLL